jgi:hypothetical protein
MPTFWISKYALTQGIFTVEANEPSSPRGLISVPQTNSFAICYHGEGRDWHRTYASAADKANEMVKNKIESLKAQLKKLEITRF